MRGRHEKFIYKVLVGKCEGKRPLGTLKQIGCEGVDWIQLAQDRV
jgi:hypothetical protein